MMKLKELVILTRERLRNEKRKMIRSCDYCLAVFDDMYWSWCIFSNDNDNSKTTLCSICEYEIFINQKEDKE
jgi:hypothetical protein